MADVPDSTLKILTSEVGNDSPATSATMYKIGGAINYLLDIAVQFQEYATPGVHIFGVPANVEQIYFIGCGGGGGGGGVTSTGGRGSGGGGGAPIISGFLRVTPSTTLTITVGNGGSPGGFQINGGTGGTSSIVGPGVFVQMPGGGGGQTSALGFTGLGGSTNAAPYIGTSGGVGGIDFILPPRIATPGQASIFGNGGGAPGASPKGGGGGGAAFGNGGDGAGPLGTPAATTPSSTSYGSGGGGAAEIGAGPGAGMHGIVRIWYGF